MHRTSIAVEEQGSLWEGAALVAGTAIGGGMLAIPLYTFQGGFAQACIASLIAWACLTATGLAFCRVLSVSPDQLSFLSLVGRWLGQRWQPVTSLVFMGLIWLLLVAYCAGGAALVPNGALPSFCISLLFVIPLGIALNRGRATTSRINSWLFTLMIAVGLLFALLAGPQWDGERLLSGTQKLSGWWWALPVLFAAFGFHNVLPTVRMRMGPDLKRLTRAVLLGTSLALGLILGWQALVFGCLSQAELSEIARLGQPVTCSVAMKSSWAALFSIASLLFAYLAMATSFLGVAQAGLEVMRQRWGERRYLASLILLVGSAWIAAQIYPDIFGRALSAAGGFGVTLLNGCLPIALLFGAVRMQRLQLHRWEPLLWMAIGAITLVPAVIELLPR